MKRMIIKKLKTHMRKEAIDITESVKESIEAIDSGIVVVYVPHTTVGVCINEAYDRDVASDIIDKLSELVPFSEKYRHLEGNADAHIQSTIVGSSVSIIISNSTLVLGRWQGIFFMEFDGPRNREFYIKIIEG